MPRQLIRLLLHTTRGSSLATQVGRVGAKSGEAGVETWESDSWKNRSGTNVWSFMTVDAERGLVFAPTGSPTSDFYGADRKGKNLYGNSLLALDAKTGALLWKASLGSQIVNGPITYAVDGKQYVATISGLSLCVFGLRE